MTRPARRLKVLTGRTIARMANILASGRAASLLLLASILAAFLTYGAFTTPHILGPNTLGLTAQDIIWILNVDAILLGTLALSVILSLVQARRDGKRFRTRLELRLVTLFAGLAVAPAVVVSAIAAVFFSYSIDVWFNEKVNSALKASLDVADAYLLEHQSAIRADARAMSADLERETLIYGADPFRLARLMTASAEARSLTEAILFNGSTGDVLARSPLAYGLSPDLVSEVDLKSAREGDVVLKLGEEGDRMRALVKYGATIDGFILVGRWVEPKVISAVRRNQNAVRLYEDLRTSMLGVQERLVVIFILTTLLIALAASWAGLLYADDLLGPLAALISAARRVGDGDLSAELKVAAEPKTEIDSLSQRFNIMLRQLREQQRDLLAVNQELGQRNALITSVLSGSSAGVISLDDVGKVSLANRSALMLLKLEEDDIIGHDLALCIPEFAEVAKRPRLASSSREWEIERRTADGRRQVFQVRSTLQNFSVSQNQTATDETQWHQTHGSKESVETELPPVHVITFDDVTGMIEAQRKLAWSDIAQRMAHEIKNPLTPIQLAAERLLSKYGPQTAPQTTGETKKASSDKTGRSDFQDLVETIVRQVDDIRVMVTEFSQFARLPQAKLAESDLVQICRDTQLLVSEQDDGIAISIKSETKAVIVACDAAQIRQALVNLLLNSVKALKEADNRKCDDNNNKEGDHKALGEIVMQVTQSEQETAIIVEDNGIGLPTDLMDRLTEPYVTSSSRGTGLGLAIVSQIMDNHKGQLVMENRQEGGAKVMLVLPNIG